MTELIRTLFAQDIDRRIEEVIKVDQDDESLVRQVFANLLGNALKFTARQPRRRIEVGSRADGDRTFWYVKDDGIGFDPADAERIFLAFERLHRDDAVEGSGVGLAIVRRIVERHGGAVRAESSPGAGATFSFSLGDGPA